jgi:hypothetical protein
LQRTQLTLPLRSGRATRHTHDYKRHGVLDLLDDERPTPEGWITARWPGEVIALLESMKHVVRVYPDQELHVILDNSSAHSTPEVQAWLAEHPRVQFHYTPTSASWLNQVEGFFGILGKQRFTRNSCQWRMPESPLMDISDKPVPPRNTPHTGRPMPTTTASRGHRLGRRRK